MGTSKKVRWEPGGVEPAKPALFCHLKAKASHDTHCLFLCGSRGQRGQRPEEFPSRLLQANGLLAPGFSERCGDRRDVASDGQEDPRMTALRLSR